MYSLKVRRAAWEDHEYEDSSAAIEVPSSPRDRATESLEFSAGNPRVEHISGVVHLYRHLDENSVAKDFESRANSIPRTLPPLRTPTLCILALPSDVGFSELSAFMGAHFLSARNVKLVRREGSGGATLVLITFASQSSADSFFDECNRRPFSPLEPDLACHLLFVKGVEVTSRRRGAGPRASGARPVSEAPLCAVCPPAEAAGSSPFPSVGRSPTGGTAAPHVPASSGLLPTASVSTAAQGPPAGEPPTVDGSAEGTSSRWTDGDESSPPPTPPPGTAELPACPVCLERLDEEVSGLVTTLCNHVFHGECLRRWGDTSCPVCRYCVGEDTPAGAGADDAGAGRRGPGLTGRAGVPTGTPAAPAGGPSGTDPPSDAPSGLGPPSRPPSGLNPSPADPSGIGPAGRPRAGPGSRCDPAGAALAGALPTAPATAPAHPPGRIIIEWSSDSEEGDGERRGWVTGLEPQASPKASAGESPADQAPAGMPPAAPLPPGPPSIVASRAAAEAAALAAAGLARRPPRASWVAGSPRTPTSRQPPSGLDPSASPWTVCVACGSSRDLWMCLLCGRVGCGRYAGRHAEEHWQRTGHGYALDLETQRVWDYVRDAYVHRIVASAKGGGLVEVPRPEDPGGRADPRSAAADARPFGSRGKDHGEDRAARGAGKLGPNDPPGSGDKWGGEWAGAGGATPVPPPPGDPSKGSSPLGVGPPEGLGWPYGYAAATGYAGTVYAHPGAYGEAAGFGTFFPGPSDASDASAVEALVEALVASRLESFEEARDLAVAQAASEARLLALEEAEVERQAALEEGAGAGRLEAARAAERARVRSAELTETARRQHERALETLRREHDAQLEALRRERAAALGQERAERKRIATVAAGATEEARLCRAEASTCRSERDRASGRAEEAERQLAEAEARVRESDEAAASARAGLGAERAAVARLAAELREARAALTASEKERGFLKALSDSALRDQQEHAARVSDLRRELAGAKRAHSLEVAELRDQLRDLMVFIQARDAIEAEGGGGGGGGHEGPAGAVGRASPAKGPALRVRASSSSHGPSPSGPPDPHLPGAAGGTIVGVSAPPPSAKERLREKARRKV